MIGSMTYAVPGSRGTFENPDGRYYKPGGDAGGASSGHSGHSGLSGLGDGRPVASVAEIVDMSAHAEALNERAKALAAGRVGPDAAFQAPAILGEASSLEAQLNSFEPWTDSNHPPAVVSFLSLGLAPRYDDSSIVRSNIQSARNNVQIYMAGASASGDRPGWRPTDTLHSINTADMALNTASNIPGEMSNVADCIWRGMRYDGNKCVPVTLEGPSGVCSYLPSGLSWLCANPGKVALGLLAVASAPYVVPAVARTIRGVL